MLDTREIHSLTDFLRNHKTYVNKLKETNKPQLLTVNGKAELVIQSAESYQNTQELLEKMRMILAIKEGFEAAERNEMKPAEQVFSEMKAKYGISS